MNQVKSEDMVALAQEERAILLGRADEAMKKGVRIRDPERLDIRGELICGSGVEIDINVVIEGKVVLGDDVQIGAYCILIDSTIGDGCTINPYSLVQGAVIGGNSFVGPYGRVRPGSILEDEVQIGNFVEIKNANIGSACRINHHAFVGDAALRQDVTIGAGTIICNHDSVKINRTVIEEGAFIGSGCNLVAPLTIGAHATIGSGSTITDDVPAEKLTIARTRQTTIEHWQGPRGSKD